ncbi:MAG: cysteine desulfurase-like protein [Candidatus Zhuqueibacterota bacterium]
MNYQIDYIRSQFPALNRTVNGFPAIYFDGPGGTQAPQRVIDKMVDYLQNHNANTHGEFATSRETDEILLNAKKTFADFFGCAWNEVSFCHNSTTINFKLAQAIGRSLAPGDEIIITDMDHEANRGPWEALAERGMVIKNVRMNPAACTLDIQDFQDKLSARTRVVAFNYASNALGTISDAKEMIRLAKQVKALTVVDAVHFALHGVIDVREIGADFLFCSAYKFFGPHVGVLFGAYDVMDRLNTLRVSTQESVPPWKFETGTLNQEGIAGAAEAVDFIADIGATHRENFTDRMPDCSERRKNIIRGMRTVEAYEQPLAQYFKDELARINGLKIYSPPKDHPCTSTISFRLKDVHPNRVAVLLGERGIFVWDGHFYAAQIVKSLGLEESGGLVRIGLAPYSTREEIDRALAEIAAIASGQRA